RCRPGRRAARSTVAGRRPSAPTRASRAAVSARVADTASNTLSRAGPTSAATDSSAAVPSPAVARLMRILQRTGTGRGANLGLQRQTQGDEPRRRLLDAPLGQFPGRFVGPILHGRDDAAVTVRHLF